MRHSMNKSIIALLFFVSCAVNAQTGIVEENGLKLQISDMEDIAFGFVHTGNFSPDYHVRIKTEEVDPGAYRLVAITGAKTVAIENISGSPQNLTWSSSGKYVVFNNVDVYAGDGSTGITLLNVQSGKYIEIGRDQFINGKDLGQREKLDIYNIVWLDSNRFSLVASAGYLGESGHPGINYNRMIELGDNFGNRDDIVLVANWVVEIVNDDSKIPDEPVEEREFTNNLMGYWQNDNDTNNYINFTENEIIYSNKGMADEIHVYVLSDDSMFPEFIDTGNTPELDHYIYTESNGIFWYVIVGPYRRTLSILNVRDGTTEIYVQ